MKNLSIKSKITLNFAILLLVMGLLGLISLLRMSTVNDQSTIIADNWLPSVQFVSAMNVNTSDFRIAQSTHILSTTDAGMTKAEGDMKAVLDLLAANRSSYEPLISSAEEKAIYDTFSQQWDAYMANAEAVSKLSRANENEQALALFSGESRAAFDAASATLAQLVKLNQDGAAAASAEGDAIYGTSKMIVIGMLVLSVLVMLGGGVMLVRSISLPIGRLQDVMTVLATGKLETEVPFTDQREEVGAMAKAVEAFRDSMVTARDLAAREQAEQAKQVERGQRMELAVNQFDRVISEIVNAVNAAATQLQATAQSLTATAEETSQQSNAVAAAAEQMSQNVQTVASATEELSSSIREIGNQVTESSRIVGNAVNQAADTNQKVKALAEAAQKIGAVVTLINEIAGQTNLLALNATIEAARAGEAGKGFAVVASEVKNLATQTAKATDEISGQVRSIQDATASSADAIDGITQTIGRVNEISTAIASAVEEQGAATQEISRNVQEASSGTQEVSSNISGVTQASQQTSAGASQVLGAAAELARNGVRLKQEVDGFLATVRAA
jgi:methyl-accepting chemotaxis protein